MIRTLSICSLRSTIAAVIALAAVAAGSQSASAQINYGNYAGLTVVYENVTESSGTDPIPQFGAPTVFVNTLDFNPVGFTAFSSGGGAPDITDGQLNFAIRANTGYVIPFVNFSERGDFILGGTGTAATYVDVSALFTIDIVEVDGVTISPLSFSASMLFSPTAGGTFTLPGYPGPGSSLWSGALSIDVNSILTANNIPFVAGATKILFALDNTLIATSETGSSSFISKKDFKGLGITVFDPVVPEPSTLALTLCGAALLGRFRRSVKRH